MSHFEMNMRSVCEVCCLAFPKVFQSAAARESVDISHLFARYLTNCLCPIVEKNEQNTIVTKGRQMTYAQAVKCKNVVEEQNEAILKNGANAH